MQAKHFLVTAVGIPREGRMSDFWRKVLGLFRLHLSV